MITYRANETVRLDNGTPSYTYDFEAVDEMGNVVQCIQNISSCKAQAEHIVKMCNDNYVELVHMKDVAEDIINEERLRTVIV